jgi:hypothetical protein
LTPLLYSYDLLLEDRVFSIEKPFSLNFTMCINNVKLEYNLYPLKCSCEIPEIVQNLDSEGVLLPERVERTQPKKHFEIS